MLRALQDFLRDAGSPRGEAGDPAVSVELATAVLLVEAMRADQGVSPEERDAIARALQQRFGLAPAQVQELLALAEERSRRANDYFAFTHALNERLTHPQKIEVIEQMWRIAWVDGSADPGESHVISRVAGLLHVTHGEYIAAKLRAQRDRLSASGPSPG
jgi:uncharacterized tellurite resistance protein B-like protein